MVVAHLTTNSPKRSVAFQWRRLRDVDSARFESALRRSELFTRPAETANAFAEQIVRVVVAELNNVAPIRRASRRPPKPVSKWLSRDAVFAKRRRRQLERRWQRSRSEVDRAAYRRACRVANSLINKSRRNYFQNRLEQCTQQAPAKRWRIVNELLHSHQTDKTRTDDENRKLVISFADYFSTKIVTLKSAIASKLASISLTHTFADHPHTDTTLSSLHPVTISEVAHIINTVPLKSSSADLIPPSIIKSCHSVFAELICHLANLSFLTGCFPTCFKHAVVTPLLKKPNLDKSSPSNYRPISNLDFVSKILERLFSSRLQSHILNSSNFNSQQSAYRPRYSTETALLSTVNSIRRSSDAGSSTLLVSLDLSAAFDTIDHNILIRRLGIRFGVTGLVLSWLQSYLSNRTQSVRIGGQFSFSTDCTSGVPQGSVLGPLLFSVYTSPTADIAKMFDVSQSQYADDTQLFVALSPTNISDGVERLSSCLSVLHQWFCLNGMALNPDKSEAIVFGTRQRHPAYSSLTSVDVCGHQVPITNHIKVLGVTLDSHLTMANHITSVCRSSFYHIRAFRHIRSALTEDMSKSVATSLVGSRVDYANSILHGSAQKHIARLQRVQNALARVVSGPGAAYRSSSLTLQSLHWLPVEQRINYKIAMVTFNALHTGQPEYLRSLLNYRVSSRALRSSDAIVLSVPCFRTEFGSRAFSTSAPRIWNSLPPSIRSNTSCSTFRRHLKTHFFTQAFNSR